MFTGSVPDRIRHSLLPCRSTGSVPDRIRHSLLTRSLAVCSGLCGSAIGTGLVVDFTKYMNRLLHIDYDEKTFECQPGFRFVAHCQLVGRALSTGRFETAERLIARAFELGRQGRTPP